MGKKVYFITSFPFPRYDAGATRIAMFARALKERGCEVELCGVGDDTIYDGIVCRTLNPYRTNKLLNWLAFRLLGFNAILYARQVIERADAIVSTFLPSAATQTIKQLCHDAGVPFCVDCTEWFSPEEFEKGDKDSAYIDHLRLLTEVIDSSVNVVAISSYLERYFLEKGCNVLRIPSVLDYQELVSVSPYQPFDSKVSFMYAGSPGLKDSIGVVLEAISSLDSMSLKSMSFDFYGADEDALLRYVGNRSPLPSCVHAHGRVPREEVLSALRSCDFTILMRDPSMRFAQAGMPTKVTESLGCGTPVVSNIVSDLGDYLEDGANSVVVKDYSSDSCARALRKAASISVSKRLEMRENARSTMRSRLDYRRYAAELEEFIFGAKL